MYVTFALTQCICIFILFRVMELRLRGMTAKNHYAGVYEKD